MKGCGNWRVWFVMFYSMEPGTYNSRSPVRKRSASFRKIAKQKKMEGRFSEVVSFVI